MTMTNDRKCYVPGCGMHRHDPDHPDHGIDTTHPNIIRFGELADQLDGERTTTLTTKMTDGRLTKATLTITLT